tara:strand:- start:891 stop:1334 length:444 start_codon:yes stop_codon:yes gene_type:complete
LEYFVLILAILLLVGSISIAMPSKSSREISKIRMEAKMMGVKIASTIYGKNKFKNKNSNSVSYQIKNETLLKEGHFIRDKTNLILYSPVKLKYIDNFESIEKHLNNLSESIEEIIFTDSFVFFLWKELDGLKELNNILDKLRNLKNF